MMPKAAFIRQPRVGFTAALLATVVATALLVAVDNIQPIPNISLIYVPVVLACGTYLGLGPALFAAVLSVAEYDYFLLEPKLTLTVARIQDVLALVILCLVAAVAAQLTNSSRMRAQAAELRADESAILTELSDALLSAESISDALDPISNLIVRVLGVRSCVVFIPSDEPDGGLEIGGRAGIADPSDDGQTRSAMSAASHVLRSASEVTIPMEGIRTNGKQQVVATYVPLVTDEREVVGVMEVQYEGRAGTTPTSPNNRILRSVSTQAAMAIQRSRAQNERRQIRILEETDRLKSSLLSAVSHDLRTPLASIKTSVTSLLLSDGEWTRSERVQLLQAIDEEADRLNRLVGNVLDVSRIESGALRPLKDWYDVNEVVGPFASKDRRVKVVIEPDVSWVQVDLVLIRQVLTNLVENAGRYAPSDSGITIRVSRCSDEIRLEVADHGPGIPFDRRERIFRPFVSSGEHGDRKPGVGLGLAICRGIVEAHGGRLTVHQTEGGGATFAIQLPQPTVPEPVRG